MYERLIKDARIVNEGEEFRGHILIHQGKIHAVIRQGDPVTAEVRDIIDAGGLTAYNKNSLQTQRPGTIEDPRCESSY